MGMTEPISSWTVFKVTAAAVGGIAAFAGNKVAALTFEALVESQPEE